MTEKKILRWCLRCGERIPQERLDVLPDANTCVRHSNARALTGDTPGVVEIGNDFDDLVAINTADHGG